MQMRGLSSEHGMSVRWKISTLKGGSGFMLWFANKLNVSYMYGQYSVYAVGRSHFCVNEERENRHELSFTFNQRCIKYRLFMWPSTKDRPLYKTSTFSLLCCISVTITMFCVCVCVCTRTVWQFVFLVVCYLVRLSAVLVILQQASVWFVAIVDRFSSSCNKEEED